MKLTKKNRCLARARAPVFFPIWINLLLHVNDFFYIPIWIKSSNYTEKTKKIQGYYQNDFSHINYFRKSVDKVRIML